ncbi:MAG: hypothetical protein KAH17_01245 [Bacteroidales bacterium]|nr:hypothetical protein [Bacteroidales bacterium]
MTKNKLSNIILVVALAGSLLGAHACQSDPNKNMPPRSYQGEWVEGSGDQETLKLIDQAFRSLHIAPDMATVPLLYKRDWDGFVEGHYWDGWWLQNSFGPTYGMLPFWTDEPYKTWIRHSQSLWFNVMGDGERAGRNGYVAPDGSLMDCAIIFMNGSREDGFRSRHSKVENSVFDGQTEMEKPIYRQGDGDTREYDWYYGGATAGIIMEAERLLSERNILAIKERLPQLKRVADFIDARRDPETNLIKGGRSSNLLAPSFGGVKQEDGGYDTAYLTELSVNFCASLSRLIELCKMAEDEEGVTKYSRTLSLVKDALPALLENDEYYIRYQEDNGTRHGIYQAEEYGYIEATPNHDAVAMGVTDDNQSKMIVDKLLSVPELYPNNFILPNHPAYDDLDNPTVLYHLPPGMWVDGGFWSTTQGRMNIACLRVNEFDHPFKAWAKQLKFMQAFRAGAPMKDYGQSLWDDKIQKWGFNVVYDCWGVPGGLLRGLFEYTYQNDLLKIRPHLPETITRYIQKHPVKFGETNIYLSVTGNGKPRIAKAKGQEFEITQEGWILIKADQNEENLCIEIICGDAEEQGAWQPLKKQALTLPVDPNFWEVEGFTSPLYPHITPKTVSEFYTALCKADLEESYEGGMSKLILEHLLARQKRLDMIENGILFIPDIPGTPPAIEADISEGFVKQARFLTGGLVDHLSGMSYWNDPVNPEILKIAKQVELIK